MKYVGQIMCNLREKFFVRQDETIYSDISRNEFQSEK